MAGSKLVAQTRRFQKLISHKHMKELEREKKLAWRRFCTRYKLGPLKGEEMSWECPMKSLRLLAVLWGILLLSRHVLSISLSWRRSFTKSTLTWDFSRVLLLLHLLSSTVSGSSPDAGGVWGPASALDLRHGENESAERTRNEMHRISMSD